MANDKSVIEEAYPGDVIGLYDNGNFKIGDTLTEGESMSFKGIPSFSPEIFKVLENKDPLKTKQLEKGIMQLTDEGVAKLFVQKPGNVRIVGTVGELQFDVIQFRLLHEYGASCVFTPLNYQKACWFTATDKAELERFNVIKRYNIAADKEGRSVFFADSMWSLKMTQDTFPSIEFHFTSEFK
jgi:peptide chain release factor 3